MLEAMDAPARDARLLPPDSALTGIARLDVDAPTATALGRGQTSAADPGTSGIYRCYGPAGRFVGLVESAQGRLRALRLMRTGASASAHGADALRERSD
jgi:hypothetical protein